MSTRNRSEPHWLIDLLRDPIAQMVLVIFAAIFSVLYYQGAKDASITQAMVNTWIAKADAQAAPLAIQLVDEEPRRCVDALALMRHRGFVLDLGDTEPATVVKIVQACDSGRTINVTFWKTAS